MGNHWPDVMFFLGSTEEDEREKRVDFYLTAAVKNSAHEVSPSVGQPVSKAVSKSNKYLIRDIPPPTHRHTNIHTPFQ